MKHKNIDWEFVVVIAIAVVILVSGLIYAEIYEPPKTIEKDGYTYELYEIPPEEFIEYGGRTYKLEREENAQVS